MSVSSLGYFEAAVDGRILSDWNQHQSKRVFKWLLALYPAAVRADTMCAGLWPNLTSTVTRPRLWSVIHRLRARIQPALPPERIVYADGCYRLVLTGEDFWDVQAVRQLEPGLIQGNQAVARHVVTLIRGRFLEEEVAASWADPVRLEMEAALGQALSLLHAAALARGSPAEAAVWMAKMRGPGTTRHG
ncbi:MAG: hypothetical protein M0Z53_13205 [Thermaerobacter sp.]|nr:hypothetical protein [Thermaerobacter sp.]